MKKIYRWPDSTHVNNDQVNAIDSINMASN